MTNTKYYMKVVGYIMGVITLVLFLSSCATRTQIEYRDRVVDHYNTVTVHDTLRDYSTDSTYHTIVERNETIYNTVYRERTRWRDRIVEKHDTCWRDSVVTEYKEKTKEVRYVPKIYRYALVFSIFVIIFVGVEIYKRF